MIIILGVLVAVLAVAAGVAGVAANTGEANRLGSEFSVFDYQFGGTTGELFLLGIVVGLVGGVGVSLTLSGVLRSTRKNMAVRRELRESRRVAAAARADQAGDRKTPARTTHWPVPQFLRKSGSPARGTTTK